MNKRLRKKKHLAEFTVLGFEARAVLRSDMSRTELNTFSIRFIDGVEALALYAGGGIGHNVDVFVTRGLRVSATEVDRASFSTLLSGDTDVVSHEIGPLRDAWNS